MLGFGSCGKADFEETFTVKGKVTNKATKEPIKGIRVGYNPMFWGVAEYGVQPTPFQPKSHVLTNAKGEFLLSDRFSDKEFQMVDNKPTLFVSVSDTNGLFQSQFLQVVFSDKTSKGYEANIDVELTENNFT